MVLGLGGLGQGCVLLTHISISSDRVDFSSFDLISANLACLSLFAPCEPATLAASSSFPSPGRIIEIRSAHFRNCFLLFEFGV